MSEPSDRVRALLGGTWAGQDAAEATLATLGEAGDEHWPVLPELPHRGPGADPVGRTASLLPDLAVDLQPHGWRISPPGSRTNGIDHRRAASHLAEDLHRIADTAGAEGREVERLAVRVVGPLTLLGSLWLPGGERVAVDAGARRDVAAAWTEGVATLLGRLRTEAAAGRTALWIDEPLAAAVLAGALPTASGYRTVRSVPRDEARAHWRDALASLAGSGVAGAPERTWIDAGRHGCAAGEGPAPADLALLASESLPASAAQAATGRSRLRAEEPVEPTVGVALDAPDADAPGGAAAWEVLGGWSEAGRPVALRHATGRGPEALMRDVERVGLDPALTAGWTLTGPAVVGKASLRRTARNADELEERRRDLAG
ncbi:hypothetical protein ACL90Y_05540 [Micrococcus luteus]